MTETLRAVWHALTHSATPGWALILMAVIPVIAWLLLFIRTDAQQPEPAALLRQTFVAGVLCTVPVVLYSRYAALHPSVDLYALFSAITSVEWIRLGLFFLAVAIIEEYVKHVAMVWAVSRNRHEFTQVVDGVVYGVAAAMGFAFLENVVYLSAASQNVVFLVFLSRALGATLGHAVFSGTFGYFYARAAFAKDLLSEKRESLWEFHRALPLGMGLHILRTHILPRRGIMEKGHTRAQLIAEGYWMAVLLHFVYNAIASSLLVYMFPALGEYDLTYLVVPLLMLGLFWLLGRFVVPANQKLHRAATDILTFPESLLPTIRARKIRRALRLSKGF